MSKSVDVSALNSQGGVIYNVDGVKIEIPADTLF